MTTVQKQDDRIIDPTQTIWVAGYNDVGYSPDPENVAVFATQAAARDYIADEIERVADGLDAVAWETDEPDELADGAHADAENVRHNADHDFEDDFYIHVEDGRSLPTSFWVQASTLGQTFGDGGTLDLEKLDKDDQFQRLLEELPEIGEVYVTATSATPVYDADHDVVELEERSGWVDPNWSRVYLHDEKEDVRPLWSGTDPADAADAIKSFLGTVEASGDSRGSRGTYYGGDTEQDSDVTFSYAAHVWGWPEDKVKLVDQYVATDNLNTPLAEDQLAILHEKAAYYDDLLDVASRGHSHALAAMEQTTRDPGRARG
jgi:hypothetical protein